MFSLKNVNNLITKKEIYNLALDYYRSRSENIIHKDIIHDRSLWFTRDDLIEIYIILLKEGVYN